MVVDMVVMVSVQVRHTLGANCVFVTCAVFNACGSERLVPFPQTLDEVPNSEETLDMSGT